MIKLFLSVTFATALMGLVAYGQTSSSSSTTVATGSNGTTETTTTTTESLGTVTDFTPGETIVLKTEAGEPARYKFSKTVTYQTADGRVIEPSKSEKIRRFAFTTSKVGTTCWLIRSLSQTATKESETHLLGA